jgi:Asp-tRNA(Asn)/Glu-tRNA(Gln) amidotransferase A subunit family amidase
LVSIAGIVPLDWLLDNTGPIARTVTDAAIALGVMAGEDPMDYRTAAVGSKAQPGPYTQYLKLDALKGKRIGVPTFIIKDENLRPETQSMFNSAIEGLRTAGATVVFDDSLLPPSFEDLIRAVDTRPYHLDGTQLFLKGYGPAQYHSVEEYLGVVGSPIPPVITAAGNRQDRAPVAQVALFSDPQADANVYEPRKKAVAAYVEAFDKLQLDALVYPAAQMPPPDETMPQDGRISSGPHSQTGWVNKIGTPAVVVPGGFYPSGLPFGIELAARPWKDGDLLGYAYAFEQVTKYRKPPVLVEKGLLAAVTLRR